MFIEPLRKEIYSGNARAYIISVYIWGCRLSNNYCRDQHLQSMKEHILVKSRTFVNTLVVIKALEIVVHLLGIGNLFDG